MVALPLTLKENKMKTKKTALQKFTESEKKVEALWGLQKITPEDVGALTDSEKKLFDKTINAKAGSLTGAERDTFFSQIEPIVDQETKNQTWEYNHNKITQALSNLMQEYNTMPTKNQLAVATGLSRQSIHNHLKEYATHPLYAGMMDQFRFMSSKVLAKVFKFAVNGDIRACRLYFDVLGANNTTANNTLIKNQNNYIQINNTVLSQENIKSLSPEQLNVIEEVLKTALPAPTH